MNIRYIALIVWFAVLCVLFFACESDKPVSVEMVVGDGSVAAPAAGSGVVDVTDAPVEGSFVPAVEESSEGSAEGSAEGSSQLPDTATVEDVPQWVHTEIASEFGGYVTHSFCVQNTPDTNLIYDLPCDASGTAELCFELSGEYLHSFIRINSIIPVLCHSEGCSRLVTFDGRTTDLWFREPQYDDGSDVLIAAESDQLFRFADYSSVIDVEVVFGRSVPHRFAFQVEGLREAIESALEGEQ